MRQDKKVSDGLDRWEQLADELLGEKSVAPNILPAPQAPEPEPEPEPERPRAHDLPQSAGFAEAAGTYSEEEDDYSASAEFEELPGGMAGDEHAEDGSAPPEVAPEREKRSRRRGGRGRGRGRRSDRPEPAGRGEAADGPAVASEPREEMEAREEMEPHEEFDDESPQGFADLVSEEPLVDDGDEAVDETAASGIPTWAEAISYLRVVPAEGGGPYDRGGNGGRPRGRPRRGRGGGGEGSGGRRP